MILISACLLGVACRYDGKSAPNHRLVESPDDDSYVVACPEVLGGLPIPRPRAVIIDGDGAGVLNGTAFVRNDTGADVTSSFLDGAKRTLDLALRFRVKACYLKSRSPSCGCRPYAGRPIGVTAALLMSHGIPLFEVDSGPGMTRRGAIPFQP